MMAPIKFVGGPLDGFRFRDLTVAEPKATYDVPPPGDETQRLFYDLAEGEQASGAAYVYRFRADK